MASDEHSAAGGSTCGIGIWSALGEKPTADTGAAVPAPGALPPLDAQAPSHLATATFALG